MKKRSFSIIDYPDGIINGLEHLYTVRIDGKPWICDRPHLSTDEKVRLFRELLAWMQADIDLVVKLEEAK